MIWDHDSFVCFPHWNRFWLYCESIDYSEDCEAVDDAWFGQVIPGIEWKDPDTVKEECKGHWSEWADDDVDACWDQYALIQRQCVGWENGIFTAETAYRWEDESCEW